jgi:hypothetical protein
MPEIYQVVEELPGNCYQVSKDSQLKEVCTNVPLGETNMLATTYEVVEGLDENPPVYCYQVNGVQECNYPKPEPTFAGSMVVVGIVVLVLLALLIVYFKKK